jgi:hypothetical protein
LEFFLAVKRFAQHHKQHNAALKYLRAVEEAKTVPASNADFLPESMEVCVIQHPKGMDFHIDWENKTNWSWIEMVAQLVDDDIRFAVNGPDGRSGGLVGCTFEPRPLSYDHKRHHKLRLEGVPASEQQRLSVWDFVLHRKDGSAFRFHPQWKAKKVETFPHEAHTRLVEPPSKGLGKSDGPGTYKFYKELDSACALKFDPQKYQKSRKECVREFVSRA